MKTLFLTLVVIASSAVTSPAWNSPREVDWNPVPQAGVEVDVEWLDEGGDGKRVLRLQSTNAGPVLVQLADITAPGVMSENYGIAGEIRYEGVEGAGHLEMWNHFPGVNGGPASAYFTRTLADAGPLQRLSGDSDWREFALPFHARGAATPPNRLVVNLALPGRAIVFLRSARLIDDFHAGAHGWWPERRAGWFGAVGGAMFGLWGALIGVLAHRGRGRGIVMGSLWALIGIGAMALLLGAIAVFVGQPYHVWYPLLLLGGILVAVTLGNRRGIGKRYLEAEERRMAAADAVAK